MLTIRDVVEAITIRNVIYEIRIGDVDEVMITEGADIWNVMDIELDPDSEVVEYECVPCTYYNKQYVRVCVKLRERAE